MPAGSGGDQDAHESKPPLPPRGKAIGRKKGLSFVPDHVKHPERYTAYILEEGIVVGSGDFGSADGQNPAPRVSTLPAAASTARCLCPFLDLLLPSTFYDSYILHLV